MATSTITRPAVISGMGGASLPKHIVVGVDGSASSLRALDYAAMVARRNGSFVTVVFVRHQPVVAGFGPVTVDWATEFADLEEEVRAAAEARLSGLAWRMQVDYGSPARALERVTSEVGGDLLVVGHSEGGWVHRLLEGSVGGHAASGARAHVLIVH